MSHWKSCDDGYPSCRNGEATGQWCNDGCLAATVKATPTVESILLELLACKRLNARIDELLDKNSLSVSDVIELQNKEQEYNRRAPLAWAAAIDWEARRG